MATSTITVGGKQVTLVSVPDCIGFRSVQFGMNEKVGSVDNEFTSQTQLQAWPGSDFWTGTMELPPLRQCFADEWLAFLAECRGKTNAFLLGDPLKQHPKGQPRNSRPVVDGSVATNNAPMTTTLATKGWQPGAYRVLLPWDVVQIGYRMHRNLTPVDVDASGNAQITLWPSLRETPADGTPVVLNKPQGLFRLDTNNRTWNADVTRLTRLSFPVREFR